MAHGRDDPKTAAAVEDWSPASSGQIDERNARVVAARAEQGLPARIEEPAALARLASILRRAQNRHLIDSRVGSKK